MIAAQEGKENNLWFLRTSLEYGFDTGKEKLLRARGQNWLPF